MDNSQIPMRTCSLCRKSSHAEGTSLVYFGDWMLKKEMTIHYYCLLLSTHLPQRGEDHSGILGFLLRDIRREIDRAKMRNCKYCFEAHATIQCATCNEYFHLTCGHTSKCLFQFVGEFKSYCHACLPTDKFQINIFARRPPQNTTSCYICSQIMGAHPKSWIYAKCCGNGFTHAKCMKMYALSAGYYLTCIWCKDKQFREDIKYQGVFVPDREANWEREKGAYGELYRSHKRCDMEICNCPKGRDFTSATKWQIIVCKFCGAFGAHVPACIPGFEGSKDKIQEFKCDVCSETEHTIRHESIPASAHHDLLDNSLYVIKETTTDSEPAASTRETCTSNSSYNSTISQETIINVDLLNSQLGVTLNNLKLVNDGGTQIASAVYTLTQNPSISQELQTKRSDVEEMACEEESNSDDSVIADLLVQKMLDIFEEKQ